MNSNKETIYILLLCMTQVTLGALKYLNYIDWSWWQVTSLVWAPICLGLAIIIVGLTGLALAEYINRKFLQ